MELQCSMCHKTTDTLYSSTLCANCSEMVRGIGSDISECVKDLQQIIDKLTDKEIQAEINKAPEGWDREHLKRFYEIFRKTPCA